MNSEVIPLYKIDIEDMLIEYTDKGTKIVVNEVEQPHNNEIFIIRYEVFIYDINLRREVETEVRKNLRRFGNLYSIRKIYDYSEDLLVLYIRPKKKYSIRKLPNG